MQSLGVQGLSFQTDIVLIIFAFSSNFTTIWDIWGHFILPPSKTGFMFGLIPHKPLVMKASILIYYDLEEQGHGINKGAPRLFPVKSILSTGYLIAKRAK